MKIETLHIYGYGKLKNVEFHLSPVTILYGKNEAGKSTIRSFVKSILFGFPSRKNRYEPKDGGTYGGAITITTEQHGRIRIERIRKTTSTGEVTVYFEDGMQGGEEEVKKLLEGLTVSLFDSVFCFDMHGLQNIHQVKKEELGSYLFSAGAVGTDLLLQLEKKLDREMEGLFKPNGRKPLINVALQDLNKMSASLHTWQQKLGMYEEWQQKRRECEERLADLQKQKEMCSNTMKDYETMLTLQPLLLERQKHEDFLSTLSAEAFPANGLLRYNQLLAAWKPVQLRMNELSEKIEQGKKNVASLSINTSILEKEPMLEECRMQQVSCENAQQELEMLQHSIKQMKQDIETLQSNIGITGDSFFFQQLDTSLAAKEHITELVQQSKRLEEQKKQLDDRFSYSKEELEEQEEQVRHLQEQLQSAKKRETSSSKNRKTRKGFYTSLLFLVVSFAVLAIGLITKEMVFVVIFACMIIVFLLHNQRQGKMKHKPEPDIELRQLADRETFKLQQIEKTYDRIVKQYEEWEQHSYQVDQQIQTWKKKYGFSESFSYNYLLTAFERIEKIKQIYRELRKSTEHKERLQTEVNQFERILTELHIAFSLQGERMNSSLYVMSEMLKEEKQHVQHKQKLAEKVKEWEEERKELVRKSETIKSEQNNLFHSAQVQTEEEFFRVGTQYEEMQTTKKQLSFLMTQIQLLKERLLKIDITDRVTWTDNYSKLLEQQKIEWNHLLQEEQQLQQSVAKYQVEIANVEEGSSYSDILHEWEAKKSIVREQMKQWAAYATAKDILTKTKERYHQVKLPRMLEKAEKYFQFVTNEHYVKIFAPNQDQSFVVERKDGMRFHANELSQATAEQLYLSLRFSLAESFDGNVPLIIDDSFVHFDKDRTERTLSLLRLLSKTRQILFFTCHSQLLSYFETGETIHLQEKRNVI